MSKLVRLKPYNPKRGHNLRKYTHSPTGKKFEEPLGWYRVEDTLAVYLATVKQNPTDSDSPDAFDVVSEDEAKAIDKREAKEKDKKGADEPNDLTTREMRVRDATDGDVPRAPAKKVPTGKATHPRSVS